jgi:hypothetical protein
MDSERMARIPEGARQVRFGTAELLLDSLHPDAYLLTVDGVPQSYVDLEDPSRLAFDVLRRIADVVDFLPAGPLDAVHIGGAACTLPRYVASTRPGSRQLVLDVDDLLVEFVEEHLDPGSVPGLELRVEDGRAGVAACPDSSVDLVVLDAFESGSAAGGFSSLEFTREVSRVLRGPETYAVNFSDGPELRFTRRLVATVGAVFDDVLLFADEGVLRGERPGNFALVASAAALPLTELATRAKAAGFPARLIAGDELRELSRGAEPITESTSERAPGLAP